MKKLIFLTVASLGVLFAIIMMTSCNNEKKTDTENEKMSSGSESQEEKNKNTALASVNAFIAGDVEGALKEATADATDYMIGMPPVKSKDSIISGLRAWRGSLSDVKGENLLAIADGDYVTVIGDWSATFKSDFMGMKTTGKSFKIKDVDLFKFNSEGKITEHHGLQAQCAMMSQLGLDSPK